MTLKVCAPTSPIARLVVRPAVVVGPETDIRAVAGALRAANVSSALVGDSHAIVTERDLAQAWADGWSGDETVGELASHHPVVVGAALAVVEAAAVMLNSEVRHLVVVMDDGQAGVVSLRDVMAVLLSAVKPEVWLATLRVSFNAPAELWLG